MSPAPFTGMVLPLPSLCEVMDEEELARRIGVYLELDSRGIADQAAVARRLAARLFQYVRRPDEVEPLPFSETLRALLGDLPTMLYFDAKWDHAGRDYRPVVTAAAARANFIVREVDISDPLGSTLARIFRVMNIPAIMPITASAFGPLIVGQLEEDVLVHRLELAREEHRSKTHNVADDG